ncbi:lipoprotein signal peptidase [Mycoplasmopsis bovigenitalium]|uniref:Lipoprotein signal peptidase n=1 Tax=Mycoplasmopsis bovigenitalium TaxID=2112 RepID=A0A449A9V2_9BACT|nr:signal peptidase II [Mycoplasmopsis bovigenitalium]VEU61028.1 lipoprotein signal peptidase [Mycoplasmopsis bovigenitalium]
MNNQQQTKFQSFVQLFRDRFKNHKNKILINYAIFVGVCLIAILIDQLTKTFIFRWKDESKFEGDPTVIYQGAILGFRSVSHHGVTIIPDKSKLTIVLIQIISVLIFIALCFVPFFVDSKISVILFACIAAGDVGNMLDRFMFSGYVKDIVFAAFLEKWSGRELGTFNFADVFLVIGAVGLIIYFITEIIIEYIKEQKKNNYVSTNENIETTNVSNDDNKEA